MKGLVHRMSAIPIIIARLIGDDRFERAFLGDSGSQSRGEIDHAGLITSQNDAGKQREKNLAVILTSARLRYEFVTLKNVRSLWELMSAPHLREYQDVPRLSLDRFSERVRARPPEFARGTVGRHEWLIRLLRESRPIGWVSVRTSQENPFSGELGYTILRKYRRKGYATEAVQALIEASFNAEILDKITAYCVPENTASRVLLKQLGLSEMRILPGAAVVRGRTVDIVLHEIDRMSWRKEKVG